MRPASAASVVLLCSIVLSAAPADTQSTDSPTRRWILLPHNVRNVYVDRKGRAWFEDSTAMLSTEDFRRLTGDAFSGKSNTISANILLVDSRGTLWMKPHNSDDLVGFDGKSWTVQHPNPHAPDQKVYGAFRQQGWEDVNGNLFFPDSLGIFWRSADGKWGYQPLFERNEQEKRFYGFIRGTDGKYHKSTREPQMKSGGYADCRHLLAPDGSVYVWADWGRLGGTGTLGVFRFDGKTWVHYDSTNGFPCDDVRSLAAMPDGSIGFMQDGDNALHFWFIPGAVAKPPALDRLLAKLGDPDGAKREEATEVMLEIGRFAVPSLQREMTSTDSPEIRTRLRAIVDRILKCPPNLYANRFEFTAVAAVPLINGGNLLWVTAFKDTKTGQTNAEAKILIYPERPWRIIPSQRRAPGIFERFYEDGMGRLWFGTSRVEVANFGLVEPKAIIPTEMAAYHVVAGPDASGRMFLTDSMQQWAMLDESAPEHTGPALAVDKWPASVWAVVSDEGSVWTWMPESNGRQYRAKSAGALRRFHDGKWDAPPNTPGGDRLSSLFPLKHGGALAVIEDYSNPRHHRFAAFFDGTQWQEADDLRDLIVAHADALRALYDGDGKAPDFYERMRIDQAGNFWVTQWERFARYDGQQWLDLTEMIHESGPKGAAFMQPSDLQVFDGGKGVFVQDYGQSYTSWFLASHDNDVAVARSMPSPLVSGLPFEYSLVDRQGNLWGRSAGGKDKLVVFSSVDAPPTYISPGGYPIFCDRDGRIWIVATEKGILRVRQGETTSSVTIDGATNTSRMTQTPDGRLFLFHSKGLSELRLSQDHTYLVLSEVNHWVDGLPVGNDNLCFFSDASGALWILARGELVRFKPPN